jgi:cytochrome c-type biogenesis protein CcmH
MKATTKLILASAALFAVALAMVSAPGVPTAQAQATDRAKLLGGRLMCMCGCNQILTQCNHVGCSTSTEMLKKLDQLVARNESDDLTLQSFVQEYGQKVLAEPPRKGFSGAAWFIAPAAFVVGLAIVLLVISSWRRRKVAVAPAGGPQYSNEVLERVRRQADRETDG